MRRAVTRLPLAIAAAALALLLVPARVQADATAFIGASLSPVTQVRGGSVGLTLVVVGFEAEYVTTIEDPDSVTPLRQAGSASVLVQTPTGRTRLYGLAGAGLYREREPGATTSWGTSFHIGGGVKITLAGPLGLRLDYRIITLNGRSGDKPRHRLYAGAHLNF